jgi:hypothetical protein
MAARLLLFAALLCCLPVAGAAPTPPELPGESLAICLLSPAAGPEVQGRVQAVSPVADPTIFARGQFEEIRLERGDQVLWKQRSNGIEPLEGPIAWPLPPLRPGEKLLLRLRPVGISGDNFANVEVVGASAATLKATARLRQSLGRDPAAWRRAVIQALDAARTAEALALLFDFSGPSSPELNALRREVHDRACDAAILGQDDPAAP